METGILEQLRHFFPGVDMALVAGIVVLMLGVRGLDGGTSPKAQKKKGLGKGAYVLMTIAAGFVAGAITVGTTVSGVIPWLIAWVQSGIPHAAVASILYQVAKTVLPSADRYWLKRPKP